MKSEFSEGYFTGSGEIELFYRFYPNPDAQDTLVVLHGHDEHSGRYLKFLKQLERSALQMALFDLRGNGRSGGRAVYVDRFEDYLEDVGRFLEILSDKFGVRGRILLLGHSLGGLIAMHWALQNPAQVKGLILSSPCFGIKMPRFLGAFNHWIRRFSPGWYWKHMGYPNHLSHDPDEIRRHREDALIRRKISVALVDEMLKYMAKLNDTKVLQVSFPFFILMAGADKVVDGRATRRLFEKVEAPLKDLVVFEDYFHEIFNEVGQDQAFEALRKCIREMES